MASLRDLRKRVGFSQKELAERLGTDQGTISDYETRRAMPSGPRLQDLAKALGVDANDIDLSDADNTTAPRRDGVSAQQGAA